jgi:hypothetical protein
VKIDQKAADAPGATLKDKVIPHDGALKEAAQTSRCHSRAAPRKQQRLIDEADRIHDRSTSLDRRYQDMTTRGWQMPQDAPNPKS